MEKELNSRNSFLDYTLKKTEHYVYHYIPETNANELNN